MSYSLPVTAPFTITQRFNTMSVFKQFGKHQAIDYAKAGGAPIYPIYDGTMKRESYDDDGYGFFVEIEHGHINYKGKSPLLTSLYAHMQTYSPFNVGDKVKVSDVIGRIGTTGASTGYHLHFEMRVYYDNGSWEKIDPEQFNFITRENTMDLEGRVKSLENLVERLTKAISSVRMRQSDGAFFYDAEAAGQNPKELEDRVTSDNLALGALYHAFGHPMITKEEAKNPKYVNIISTRDVIKK